MLLRLFLARALFAYSFPFVLFLILLAFCSCFICSLCFCFWFDVVSCWFVVDTIRLILFGLSDDACRLDTLHHLTFPVIDKSQLCWIVASMVVWRCCWCYSCYITVNVDVEVMIRIMALYHVSLSNVDVVIVLLISLPKWIPPAYVVVTVLSFFIFIVTSICYVVVVADCEYNAILSLVVFVLFQVSCYLYVCFWLLLCGYLNCYCLSVNK